MDDKVIENIISFCDQETLENLIHVNRKFRKYIFKQNLLRIRYKYKVNDVNNIDFNKKINPYSYRIKFYLYKDVQRFGRSINSLYERNKFKKLAWLNALVDYVILSNDNERRLLQHYLHKDIKFIVDQYYQKRIVSNFFSRFREISKFHTLLK